MVKIQNLTQIIKRIEVYKSYYELKLKLFDAFILFVLMFLSCIK